MNERDRRSPRALARNAPIANLEVGLRFAEAVFDSVCGHRFNRFWNLHSAERAGIDEHAGLVLSGKRRFDRSVVRFSRTDQFDDARNRQAVFLRELEVAFVVRGHGHNRARAVTGQNEIGRPDWQFLAAERIDDEQAGVDSLFFAAFGDAVFRRNGFLLLDERFQFIARLARCDQFINQLVFGRDDHRVRAEDRVNARGEDADFFRLIAGDFKIDFRAFAATDPVALHRDHAFGPSAFQCVQIVQQLVGVIGDADEPLFQFALFDRRVFVAPAETAFSLLVRQRRVAFDAPVDGRVLAVQQPALPHLDEEPLIPPVIFGRAGSHLAPPIVAEAHPLKLGAHCVNVFERPLVGSRVVFDRSVFGWHSERVPAHRMNHIVALHAFEVRQRVADRIIAHVAHVDAARWIRQHLQAVKLFASGVNFNLKDARIGPSLLLSFFDLFRKILFVHCRVLFNQAPRNSNARRTHRLRDAERNVEIYSGKKCDWREQRNFRNCAAT
ncbi:MAG: hypothetical protein JMDDDDMK_02578 [Acidobacteria bacterium]|nr:hypothetical protein [Acidobacteriota bacterium]